MTEPFDAAAFLASSENRVRLLEAVTAEPRTRAELQAWTGIARATVGRIMTDLESR